MKTPKKYDYLEHAREIEMVKQEIKDYVYKIDLEDIAGSLDSLIALCEKLKIKYGEKSGFEIYGEYDETDIRFYYHRLETDAEYNRRVLKEKKQAEREAVKLAKKLSKDKETWEKLKKIAKEQGWE